MPDHRDTMNHRVAKSVFWLVWSRGFIQLISFGSTVVVARILQPSDYGIMALATIFTGILLLISEVGSGATVMQFRDLSEGELNLCFWFTFSLSLFSYGALFIAAPFIADWFAVPALERVLRWLGLLMPIEAIHTVPDGLLCKRLEFEKVSRADVISTATAIPVVFSLAWAGYGVWALVGASLVKSIVRSLVSLKFVRWWPGASLDTGRARVLLHFSLGIFGSNVLWSVYEQSDSFILGKIAGEKTLGLFSMAKDLALLPVTRISAVVNQLMVPLMAELQAKPAEMGDYLLRVIRLVAGVVIPVSVGLALVAEDIVRVILTDKWLGTVPVLQVLCFSAVIKGIDNLLPPVLRARYRSNFLMLYNTTLLTVMPPAFVAGALWAEGMGVALAWVTVYPVVMCWMVWAVIRELELQWGSVLRQLAAPAYAVLAMAAAVLTFKQFMPHMDVSNTWIQLCVEVALGAMAYGLGLLVFGRALISELWSIVLMVFRPGRNVVSSAEA